MAPIGDVAVLYMDFLRNLVPRPYCINQYAMLGMACFQNIPKKAGIIPKKSRPGTMASIRDIALLYRDSLRELVPRPYCIN